MRGYLMELPDFLCLALVYFAVLLPRWRGSRKSLLFRTVFYVYLCFVLHFTLMPFLISLPGRITASRINLIPFLDLLRGYGGAEKQILLNFIMMVPFGALLPLIYRKKFFGTAGLTLTFSLLIEILQFFSGGLRISDVTDVITNTAGGMAGYLLFLPFRKASLPCGGTPSAEKSVPRALPKREKAVLAVFLLQIFVKSFLAAYL
jgi:glycopeptide antibiotics resistance protein